MLIGSSILHSSATQKSRVLRQRQFVLEPRPKIAPALNEVGGSPADSVDLVPISSCESPNEKSIIGCNCSWGVLIPSPALLEITSFSDDWI